MAGELAPYRDGIPTVADATTRDALFPLATRAQDQRVYRKDTGAIERWSGSVWLPALNYIRVYDAVQYGVLADGATNDAPAINAAIAACRAAGGGRVQLPAGSIRCTEPINITTSGATASQYVEIAGMGRRSTVLSIVHTGHGIDCTGTAFLHFRDLTLSGNAVSVPKTGFFLARNSTAGSAGWVQFTSVTTTGSFSVASLYNYASEDMRDYGSTFSNDYAGGKSVYITGSNKAAQTSSFVTIATGAQSNTDQRLFGTELWNSGTGNADCLYLESCRAVSWDNAFSTVTNNGRSHVYIDLSTQPSSDIAINKIFWDGATAKYGLAYEGASGLDRVTCTEISNGGVRAMDAGTIKLSTVGFAVYGADSTRIGGFVWSHCGGTNYLRLYECNDGDLNLAYGAESFYAKYAFGRNRVRVATAAYTLDRLDLAPGCQFYFTDTGAESQLLDATTVWNPASIASGASLLSPAIAVTNAAFGQHYRVTAPYDLQGLVCTAYVSSAGNVKICLSNLTGGAVDLASGTWTVRGIYT